MNLSLRKMANNTICAVIGSTGTGKSQLSIDLAKALKGQVINGDALQVYRTANILTNKVTPQEMDGVKHHLMDFLPPTEQYDVYRFKNEAIEKVPKAANVGVDGVEVDTIHNEGDWPILVGGTHYYIQNLLFNRALVHWDDDHDSALQHPILQASDTELHEFLRKVDPEQAARYHPSSRRTVQGRVELYLRTKRPASEIFREQRESADRGTRWSTLVFWVWSGKEALFERLDRRVDKMVVQGVEHECRELYEVSNRTDIPTPAGIFAAIGPTLPTPEVLIIGYKEFLPIIQGGDNVEEARKDAISAMKANTRKYVADQLKWIRHQFLPQAKQYNVPVYILDASDPTQWTTKVRDPALRVAQAFLGGTSLPPRTEIFDGAEEFLNPTRMHSPPEEWRHWECELCGDGGGKLLIVGGEDTWEAHLHSRKHRARKRGVKKRAAFEEWKARQGREGDTLES